MKTVLVQGRANGMSDTVITYGSLVLNELTNTVTAHPPTNPTLEWLMGWSLPGNPLIRPDDLPRWFDELPLRLNGSMLWCIRGS